MPIVVGSILQKMRSNSGETSVPDAPTGLAITASASQCRVSWEAPACNGGTALIGYIVAKSVDAGANWSIVKLVSTSPTYTTMTGLPSGVQHLFRVAAKSGIVLNAGLGPFSVPTPSATPT
jgi:hypothetical protein